MPPPRLFRQLRSFQSQRSIYQVRHISKSSRVWFPEATENPTSASLAQDPDEKPLAVRKSKSKKRRFRRVDSEARDSQGQTKTFVYSGRRDIKQEENDGESTPVRMYAAHSAVRYTHAIRVKEPAPFRYIQKKKRTRDFWQAKESNRGSPPQGESLTLPIRKLDGISEAKDSLLNVPRPFRKRKARDGLTGGRDARSSKELDERTTSSLSTISEQVERLSQQMRHLQDALANQKAAKEDHEGDVTQVVAMQQSDNAEITTAESPTGELHIDSARTTELSSNGATSPNARQIKEKRTATYAPPEASTNESKETASPIRKVETSLLEELFPETTKQPPASPLEPRTQYPKLDLPSSHARPHHLQPPKSKSLREQVVESFRNRAEDITVLQLNHVSTHLVEADFRRLIPKGKHIETWTRANKAFYKIIPGRDPLSLERLPFYFLLFRTADAAYSYQNNVARIHKLAALHTGTSLFSAIPPPLGFLEAGEDLHGLTTSYVLSPPGHALHLSTLMQPYNPSLRALIERGGYTPVVPSHDAKGNPVFKVLLHISGHMSTPQDLFRIFQRDAYACGTTLPLRTESSASIHRLRDVVNLKTKYKHVASPNPGAAYTAPAPLGPDRARPDWHARDQAEDVEFEDPSIQALFFPSSTSSTNPRTPYATAAKPPDSDMTAQEISQLVMNRVYNRWLLEFSDEEAAGRFARRWSGRVLVDRGVERNGVGVGEERLVRAEVLW